MNLLSSHRGKAVSTFIISGASMHTISKKDWNSAEMDTLTTSRSLTSVKTAYGEVQTREEARVYVKELDMFMKVKIFEDTPAVFSFRKFCEDHGYSYEWTNGQTPCFNKNSVRVHCNSENYVPIVIPGLSRTSSSSSSYGTTPPT